jgi:hypothetical protein
VATIAATFERPRTDLQRVLLAGATVAFLDGLFAVVLYVFIVQSTTAGRIFQGIAAGLIGRSAALNGGAQTVALGLALHCTVAFGWTTIYYVLLNGFDWLRDAVETTRGKLIVGALFGATIWLGMNYVVVPLAGLKVAPLSGWRFWVQLVWHMIALGPPIVAIVRTDSGGSR